MGGELLVAGAQSGDQLLLLQVWVLLLVQLQVLLQVQRVRERGPLRELGVDLGDVRKSKWKSDNFLTPQFLVGFLFPQKTHPFGRAASVL